MKKKYYDHVVSMLNFEEMRKICVANWEDFAKYGELQLGDDPKKRHYFKDNGSSVLAVAHLDSVQDIKGCEVLKHPAGWRVYSPALDDRLGAYVILCLLPKLGIFPDILLTDNEEKGGTTSEFFKSKKKYNWMFSFDRAGDDVVMYQYEDDKMEKLLKDYDFTPARGSFSCICRLDRLECKGFNFGVGYHDYHGVYAYASLSQLVSQVTKFTRFFHAQQKTHLAYIKPPPVITSYRHSNYNELPARNYGTSWYRCDACHVVATNEWKCPNCGIWRNEKVRVYD